MEEYFNVCDHHFLVSSSKDPPTMISFFALLSQAGRERILEARPRSILYLGPCFIHFHMREQQPCFFLGSSIPGLAFLPSAFLDCWPFLMKVLAEPFWVVSKGSWQSFSSLFSIVVSASCWSCSSLAFKSRETSFSLPSFHSLKISLASWLSSPSGRKGLSQPWYELEWKKRSKIKVPIRLLSNRIQNTFENLPGYLLCRIERERPLILWSRRRKSCSASWPRGHSSKCEG